MPVAPLPVKVLQFGEGNFLRGFADWMIDVANEKGILHHGVSVIQPIEKGAADLLEKQDGLYHVVLAGIRGGEYVRETRLVSCVQEAINPYADYARYEQRILDPDLEFVISNTTEAGIRFDPEDDIFATPPRSFPGKVTAMLYKRFRHFNGAPGRGLDFLCCELILSNGSALKRYVARYAKAYELEPEFIEWVRNECRFYNTLVDRIVVGFPGDEIQEIREEIGYEDQLVVKGEQHHLWVISGPRWRVAQYSFPLDKAGLNVHFTKSYDSYREKKVSILNGSHTAMAAVGQLMGCHTVKEAFEHPLVGAYVRKMVDEETLPQVPGDPAEARRFVEEVYDRFRNPGVCHKLQSIALNAIPKWEVRNYPVVQRDRELGILAKCHLFALAALMVIYSRSSNVIPDDTPSNIYFFRDYWSRDFPEWGIIYALESKSLWDIPPGSFLDVKQFTTGVTLKILAKGIETALSDLIKER